MERVLHCGVVEDYAYLLLCFVHQIDSYFVKNWRSSYIVDVWKGSYTLEAWTIMLIHCWVSSTLMIPGRRDKKFLHRGTAKRFLFFESMDDYANSLLGIDHHNNYNAVEAWRSSYTVEMWRRSYVVEAWMIVLICFWISTTIMITGTRDEKFLHYGSVERVL